MQRVCWDVGSYLLDDLDLSVEACGATLDQGDVGGQTHLIDMPPCIQVIQRIEDDAEGPEPCNVELFVLDVGVVRFNLDHGVKPPSRLFCNLRRQRKTP